MRILLTIIAVLLVLYAILMALAPVNWFFELFINFAGQFALAGIITVMLLYLQKRFVLMVTISLLVFYFASPLASFWDPVSAKTSMATTAITIVQANLNYQNIQREPFIEILERERPTVVVLNEVTEVWIDRIDKVVGEAYPYRAVSIAPGYQGMAVLSQTPLTFMNEYQLDQQDSPILEVRLNETGLTIFAVHTLAPVKDSWARLREEMIHFVGEKVALAEDPVMVVGDLNMTVHSPALRAVIEEQGLRDVRQGYGWQPSWLTDTPLALAIDHILYRGETLETADFEVLEDINSDHRPLFAQFIMNTQ